MEVVKGAVMPVGQTTTIKNRFKVRNQWFQKHKIGIVVGGIAATVLVIYGILMFQFIELITVVS